MAITQGTITKMETISDMGAISLMRLLQLVSPALPIGAFAYSEGLETAVERGWVHDERTALNWICGVMEHAIATLDIPVFARLYAAYENDEKAKISEWNGFILACRGTLELHTSDRNLGSALMKVLATMAPQCGFLPLKPATAHVSAFAAACVHFNIPREAAALALTFSWVENQVSAAVRLVPLGQSDGQRILVRLSKRLELAVAKGLLLDDESICSSTPGHAMAAALHETQYSRLFRS